MYGTCLPGRAFFIYFVSFGEVLFFFSFWQANESRFSLVHLSSKLFALTTLGYDKYISTKYTVLQYSFKAYTENRQTYLRACILSFNAIDRILKCLGRSI